MEKGNLPIIFIIAFIVIFFAWVAIVDNEKKLKPGLIICCCLFMFFGCAKCIFFTKPKEVHYATERIAMLQDNNLTHSISRRQIDEELYYQYMVQHSSGGLVANRVKASTATIYYSDYPRVEWYRKEYKWLFFYGYDVIQKIYVPEGTIGDDYLIDLK